MSRIHDALKKAEQERAEGPAPARTVRPESEPTVLGGGQDEVLGSVLTEARAPAAITPPDVPAKGVELRKLVRERSVQCSWNPDRRMMLLFDRRIPILGLEEFRTLRSRLYLIREQQPLQKVLIASALPQEGKTFVAMNLAQVIVRQPERRVLLIDGDLRFSRSHFYLGAPATPGLSDYLSREGDEFSVIQRGPADNLFFIPSGKPVPNPGELVANGRLKLLLERLAPAFDWIIVDSPPAIPVSDAKMMAPLCDGVLVVVRAGTTPFDMAQKACQEFRDRCLLGVVLNRAEGMQVYSTYYYSRRDGTDKKHTGRG